jgi:hypothetical protein
MRRLSIIGLVSVSVALNVFPVRAGGGHGGGGYHGGGYGGYHGGGYHGGYYGHGCGWYGWWPFALGVGVSVAASYPAYAYSYPAYSYPTVAYTYSQPVYVTAPAATAPAAPAPSAAPAIHSYTSPPIPSGSAPAQISVPATTPAAAPAVQPQLVSVSPRPRGTWIQDPDPYRYVPEATSAKATGVTITQSGSVPAYAVSR